MPLTFKSPVIIWSVICIVIISAYWPSLTGPLVFDDQLNIIENPGVAINDLSFHSLKKSFLSNESGKLKRVLPALSFGINHYFADGFSNTFIFKITNLVIHLINTGLLFWLSLLIIPKFFSTSFLILPIKQQQHSFYLAIVVSLVWALHPLQLTPVTYVVQRMTSMAGCFTLLGLIIFVMGRNRVEQGTPFGFSLMLSGVFFGTVLGLMCKENAALLPLFAGVIEYTLFSQNNAKTNDRKIKKQLYIFYLCTLAIPLFIGLIYCFVYPGNILNGYSGRPFSLAERLFTEARVLWFYLYMLVVPDIRTMGLFHDDLIISKGWFAPWTTFVSIVTWLALLFVAIKWKKKVPVFSFAILWYLVGHSMESTFIPLKIIYEHRNYIPDIGPVFSIVFLVYLALSSLPLKQLWQKISLNTILVIITVFGLYQATHARAEYWRTETSFISSIALNHPLSANSQYLYGEVLYKKMRDPFQAYPYYFKAAQLEPDEVGFLISLTMVTPINLFTELPEDKNSQLINPERISYLLKNKPVSAWGHRALDVAGRCIKALHPSCMDHVHIVRGWFSSAIESNRVGTPAKKHFINTKFDIEMKYSLFDEALSTVSKAKNNQNNVYRYELMLADVLAAKHKYLEALQVLDQANKTFGEKDVKIRKKLLSLQQGVMHMIVSHKATHSH